MNVQLKESSIASYDRLKLHSKKYSPAIFLLSDDGMILESNTEGKKLFDYSADETDGRHISRLLPLLTEIDLLEKSDERVNPYLRFLSRIGHHFKVNGLHDKTLAGELFFSDIHYQGQHLIMIMIYPVHH